MTEGVAQWGPPPPSLEAAIKTIHTAFAGFSTEPAVAECCETAFRKTWLGPLVSDVLISNSLVTSVEQAIACESGTPSTIQDLHILLSNGGDQSVANKLYITRKTFLSWFMPQPRG